MPLVSTDCSCDSCDKDVPIILPLWISGIFGSCGGVERMPFKAAATVSSGGFGLWFLNSCIGDVDCCRVRFGGNGDVWSAPL